MDESRPRKLLYKRGTVTCPTGPTRTSTATRNVIFGAHQIGSRLGDVGVPVVEAADLLDDATCGFGAADADSTRGLTVQHPWKWNGVVPKADHAIRMYTESALILQSSPSLAAAALRPAAWEVSRWSPSTPQALGLAAVMIAIEVLAANAFELDTVPLDGHGPACGHRHHRAALPTNLLTLPTRAPLVAQACDRYDIPTSECTRG